MATSAIDFRDTLAAPALRLPSRARLALVAAPAAEGRRRPPVAVLAACLVGVLEAVALLAVAVGGLDVVLTSPTRPQGGAVALGLTVLATWVVAAAAGGMALLEGSSRRATTVLAGIEIGGVAAVLVADQLTPLFARLPIGLPVPALALLALALPVGKLLLAGAPSTLAWIEAGPVRRERRPDPVAAHRVLCTVTMAVIALALAGVAVLAPAAGGTQTATAGIVSTH